MMKPSDIDRLREYRALGTLAGMTSAGVAFGAYFMQEIFKVTNQTTLFELNLLGGVLVLGIFASALGGGGYIGRLVGEYIVYPIRAGNDAAATKRMTWLMVGGAAVTGLAFLAAILWGYLMMLLASK